MSTKIHATCDALGNPTGFHLTGGADHDIQGADALLPAIIGKIESLIADRGYDAGERVIKPIEDAGAKAIIPPRGNRLTPRHYDKHLYNRRHLIENFFARLKNYRPSPHATTNAPQHSLAPSTSPPPSHGSIDDTP